MTKGRYVAPEADELSDRVLEAALSDIARTPQRRALRVPWRFMNMPVFARAAAAALALVVVVAAGGVIYLSSGAANRPGVGGQPTPSPTASSTQPPTASPTWAGLCRTLLSSPPVGQAILGCSSDGTRFLIQKGGENLFVLHADGSETQVTEQLSGFNDIPGSGRPTGATISPDGSRVVFAGLTTRERFCHDGALFAVDADGGPAEVLWKSQRDGIVRYPSFSPDGTQIAFVDGYCDSDHSVWVMNADGSDAHQIVSSDMGPLSATHVQGLSWSAPGDRIGLYVDQGSYTFASDGSDFTRGDASEFCWPGRQCY